MGVEVVIASAAAISKVAISNGHSIFMWNELKLFTNKYGSFKLQRNNINIRTCLTEPIT